ncbi:5628_t:CDS:2 [Diversispora eburnea]|uniref:5628_t:CDS:1 n=1 Tax=Diversispora eburnea TaxID=1213867 RepID=A0A9N9AKT9_9GLOM|nr:5628_t:CDS:2 [Diversispora eburnea]
MHRQICEVAVGDNNVGYVGYRCLKWMRKEYTHAVIGIKISSPRANIQKPVTETTTQRWDFGNIKKDAENPSDNPAECNVPGIPAFQIIIPINEVFLESARFNLTLIPATNSIKILTINMS